MEPNQTNTSNFLKNKKQPGFVKWSLIIGIVIVMNLFFNYTLTLVYKAPEYDAYYARPQVVESPNNKEDCLGIGGQWTENANYKLQPINVNEKEPVGYCDPDYTKRMAYEDARKVYERNVFVTLIVLGVIVLVLGMIISIEVLATAFAWGGVLSLIIASVRYWSLADNLLKVIILAVALGLLVWVALRKFSQK